ncbi:MAG: hypothetical protein ABI534_04200 [Chloroflexota bacterium]
MSSEMNAPAALPERARGAAAWRRAEPDFGLFAILLNIIGVAALAYGLYTLRSTEIGGVMGPAIGGMLSQLPVTALPAVAVAFASVANLGLGAVAMRLVAGRPYRSLASLVLSGLVGAVLVDSALLMALGGIGLYAWPILVLVHLAGIGVAIRWAMPLVDLPAASASRLPLLAFVLPAIVWGAAVLLQLASPVVPFMDVLFNHVSPVEHVRVFGWFEVLTTSPSPNFGPSRTLLGYVALESALATITGLPAALSIAAFIGPLAVLFATAVHRLATALFGGRAGYWALITVPLSFVFLRLPDARATTLVFILVAWVLATLVDPPSVPRGRLKLFLAAGIGASLLMHPFIGALMVLTVVLLTVVWPARHARLAVPAVVGGALLALPQVAATLAIALPSWLGLLAVLPAAAGFWLADRWSTRLVRTASIIFGVGALAALLVVSDVVRFSAEALRDMTAQFPLLAVAMVAGFALLGPQHRGLRVLGAALAVGVLTVVGSRLLPPDSPLVQSLQGEVNPKALWYWGPFFMALVAAGAANRLTSLRRWSMIGQSVVGLFVIVATLPLRLAPAVIGLDNYEEHRMAESTSILLRHATQGYWLNYPDSRTLVNDAQEQILDQLRTDHAAGLIDSRTRILHLADSFRPWVGTPVAVFTGISETTASFDPERSIHTEGGRLLDMSEVPGQLDDGYGYVLVEGGALVDEFGAQIQAAGYVPITQNGRGILFRAASLTPAGN